MTNIFKSSEEEKNRIRKLHSSVLSEQEEENVDMLTNFMATGTNPYITGSGSFQVPPGC